MRAALEGSVLAAMTPYKGGCVPFSDVDRKSSVGEAPEGAQGQQPD